MKLDIKEILFGLFRSRKFRTVVLGFVVALAVKKGWLGEMSPESQADLLNMLVLGVGALVGATALEDSAEKLGSGVGKGSLPAPKEKGKGK